MNKKKILSTLSAIALMAATANYLPIAAADYTTPGGTVTFASYIVMDSAAYTPSEVIHYSITPYGSNTANMTGTPTVGDATFTLNQSSFDKVQSMDPNLTENKQSTAGTDDQDAVTLASGQKYVRTSVEVNFTNVHFNNVGTFEFVIQQLAGDDPAMTYDTEPMLMDVYVVYSTTSTGASTTDKSLTVNGYTMYKATAATTAENVTTYTQLADTKADGFINNYNVKSLTFAKTVTGNQGSHDEYFPFTVTITNAKQPGMIYNVDISGAQSLTTLNGLSTTAHSNRTYLVADAEGVATDTFWIHHKQHITVTNIPVGSEYSVNEDPAKLTKEEYTATVEFTGDTVYGEKVIPINTIQASLMTSGDYTNTTTVDNKNVVTTISFAKQSDGGTMIRSATNQTTTETYKWEQTEAYKIKLTAVNDSTNVSYLTISDAGSTLTEDSGTRLTFNSTNSLFNPGTITTGVSNPISLAADTLKVSDTYLSENTTITFTNNKVGSIPTGIITTTVPYVIVVLAGFFGLIIFAKKRRETEEEY